jgi:hypothetical protein
MPSVSIALGSGIDRDAQEYGIDKAKLVTQSRLRQFGWSRLAC